MFIIFIGISLITLWLGLWCFYKATSLRRISLFHLSIFVTGMHIGAGGLISALLLTYDDFSKFLLSQDVEFSSLVIGNVIVLIWSLLLLFSTTMLRGYATIDPEVIRSGCMLKDGKISFYIYACIVFALESLALYLQQENYGVIANSAFYSNPLTQILFYLRLSLAVLCILRLGVNKWKLLDIAIFLLTITLLVMNGRRLLFIIFSFWVFWLLFNKYPIRKLALIGFAFGLIFIVGARLFLSIRMVKEEHGELAVRDTIELGIDAFWHGETNKGTSIMSSLRDNIEIRPAFAITYIGLLVEKAEGHPAALGTGFINEIERAIPRIIYPDKDRIISIGGSEGVAERQYGLIPDDRANSVIAAGYVDFKYLYIISILYVLVILLLYNILLKYTQPGLFYYILLGPLIYSVMEYEQDLSVHLVGLRIAVLSFALGCISRLFKR